jgi:hypothetical protein
VGIHEMKPHLVAQDLADWAPLLEWLKTKEGLARPNAGINPLPETA